jgi:hypothetical protein
MARDSASCYTQAVVQVQASTHNIPLRRGAHPRRVRLRFRCCVRSVCCLCGLVYAAIGAATEQPLATIPVAVYLWRSACYTAPGVQRCLALLPDLCSAEHIGCYDAWPICHDVVATALLVNHCFRHLRHCNAHTPLVAWRTLIMITTAAIAIATCQHCRCVTIFEYETSRSSSGGSKRKGSVMPYVKQQLHHNVGWENAITFDVSSSQVRINIHYE